MKTKHDAGTYTVSQLAYLMAEHKIYLDEAFQSNTRWVTLMNQEYMRSIIEGRAITPITLGSVDEILSSIERRFGPTHLDYKFFKDLKDQGFKYITIDGNNRDNCIAKFINNEFPLAVGTDLLSHKKLKYRQDKLTNKYYGHCYHATQALYYLMDTDRLVSMKGEDYRGESHWWLQDEDKIYDVTADQYYSVDKTPPLDRDWETNLSVSIK